MPDRLPQLQDRRRLHRAGDACTLDCNTEDTLTGLHISPFHPTEGEGEGKGHRQGRHCFYRAVPSFILRPGVEEAGLRGRKHDRHPDAPLSWNEDKNKHLRPAESPRRNKERKNSRRTSRKKGQQQRQKHKQTHRTGQESGKTPS